MTRPKKFSVFQHAAMWKKGNVGNFLDSIKRLSEFLLMDILNLRANIFVKSINFP